jgi:hypothetical protein
LVTEPVHPYYSAWWPTGHVIGWEHSFTHEMADLVRAIADDSPALPTVADGLSVQRVLQAVEDSHAAHGAWTAIGHAAGREARGAAGHAAAATAHH